MTRQAQRKAEALRCAGRLPPPPLAPEQRRRVNVLVVGEAGLGKSCLIANLLGRVDAATPPAVPLPLPKLDASGAARQDLGLRQWSGEGGEAQLGYSFWETAGWSGSRSQLRALRAFVEGGLRQHFKAERGAFMCVLVRASLHACRPQLPPRTPSRADPSRGVPLDQLPDQRLDVCVLLLPPQANS